jgi:NitT/TauT family transport system ATP-binding protein
MLTRPLEAQGRRMVVKPGFRIERVGKWFPNGKASEKVLHDVTFDVGQGEIVAILGPSGCGKSTLLNLLGGFERPDEGLVLFEDQPVAGPTRERVMIFQQYGLLPWRTVRKNVELGLEKTGLSAEERRKRADETIALVGLADRMDHFPHQLSGGMQQRVALARALAVKPKVLLMDEPFGALDTFNRYHLQNELLRLQASEKLTVVLVTHDIDEAVFLADRILVMMANPGRIRREIRIRDSKPRDRGSSHFQHYRKIIYELFQLSGQEDQAEYSI